MLQPGVGNATGGAEVVAAVVVSSGGSPAGATATPSGIAVDIVISTSP